VSGTPLVGYPIVFGQASSVLVDQQGRRYRQIVDPAALDDFIALELGCPLRIDHGPTITHRGVQSDVGAVRRWRADRFGVLIYAELDDSPAAHGLAEAVASGVPQGMSWGATRMHTDQQPHWSPLITRTIRLLSAGVGEVSVTPQPAFAAAMVLGVGDQAERLWDYPDLAGVALAAAGR
jgi:phage head maturation protease